VTTSEENAVIASWISPGKGEMGTLTLKYLLACAEYVAARQAVERNAFHGEAAMRRLWDASRALEAANRRRENHVREGEERRKNAQ
jgi:hypothetical protein